MFINEEEIKYNNFQSMCRTCLQNNNLKSIKNNFIIEVLHNITDINYRVDEELPQSICDVCTKKLNEIQAFAFQCIEIDLALKKCRNKFKDEQIKDEPKKDETNQIEFNEIKDVTFDENVINIDESNSDNLSKWFENSNDVNYSFAKFEDEQSSDDDENDSETSILNIIVEEEIETIKTKRKPKMKQKIDYSCETCNKKYKTQGGLKHHRDTFQGRDHFCCEICQQIYTNKSGFIMHLKMHKLRGILICEFCNKLCYKGRSLREHKRRCEAKFRTEQSGMRCARSIT